MHGASALAQCRAGRDHVIRDDDGSADGPHPPHRIQHVRAARAPVEPCLVTTTASRHEPRFDPRIGQGEAQRLDEHACPAAPLGLRRSGNRHHHSIGIGLEQRCQALGEPRDHTHPGFPPVLILPIDDRSSHRAGELVERAYTDPDVAPLLMSDDAVAGRAPWNARRAAAGTGRRGEQLGQRGEHARILCSPTDGQCA